MTLTKPDIKDIYKYVKWLSVVVPAHNTDIQEPKTGE